MTNRITALSPGIVLVVTMVAASTQHYTKKQAAALPLTAKNLEARRLVHQAMMFDNVRKPNSHRQYIPASSWRLGQECVRDAQGSRLNWFQFALVTFRGDAP